MKIKTKQTASESTLPLPNLNDATGPKNISLWRIMATFAIVNLVIINIVNYWQPINHKELKNFYDNRQNIILSAYDLQEYFNEFKDNPDRNAFNIIHKTVNLTSTVAAISSLQDNITSENATKLNVSIEKIVDSIPVIKLLQQNVDKILRSIKTLKSQIFNNVSDVKHDLRKSLYEATDKMERLVQNIKFGAIDQNLVDVFQKSIEDLGFEVEQFNNILANNDISTKTENIVNSVTEIYDEISALMPGVGILSESYEQLNTAKLAQNNIIQGIRAQKASYTEIVDDKTVIIATIILTNLLLLFIIIFTKLCERTNKVITDYRNKKKVYYLTHVAEKSAAKITAEAESGLLVSLDEAADSQNSSQSIHYNRDIDFSGLDTLKQKIVNDCYILQNNLDKIEKFYQSNNLIVDEHKIPTHILLILYKLSNNILDNAVMLDKKINLNKQAEEQHSTLEIKPENQPEVIC